MTGNSSSPQPLMDEEVQYLSLILEIIDQQNWEAFGYMIIKNPMVFQSFARTIQATDELNGMTILHACLRFNPPPQIVKILLDLVPESPSRVDCLKRTPLHVATGTRASLQVIELLAKAYPKACAVQDEDGKTPLHLACDSTCELFEGDSVASRDRRPSFEVVRTLIKVNPLCVPLEDRDDMSALEHAIFSDAPIRVVKFLQYATKKQCERQQNKESMKLCRKVSQESQDLPKELAAISCLDAKSKRQQKLSSSCDIVAAVPVIPATQGEYSMSRRRCGIIPREMVTCRMPHAA